jgi:uncharacterized protein YqjF (DUF2071 family)
MPTGLRLLRLSWSNVLFLHWPVEAEAVRSRLPPELELELFDGRAWVTVVASTVSGARPAMGPPLPGLSSFLELHVRTYVVHGDQSGVFFLSIDTSNPVVAWAARSLFRLPCFRARMETLRRDETVRFVSERAHQGASKAGFECVWGARRPLPRARPGDLVHFLTERYLCLAVHREKVLESRLWHEAWELREARIGTFRSTMLEAAGLPAPQGAPLAHHADALALSVWPARAAEPADPAAPLLDPALSPPVVSLRRGA